MSNSEVVISVENLWKEYRYGTISHATLKKDLQSWWARRRGKPDPNSRIDFNQARSTKNQEPNSMPSALSAEPDGSDSFWALRDISFEVKQGEVLGIIGKNGAGKSTLLKIMSRVTTPTKGQVKLKGRVASLLEVGTGFHGELTGRENIFLNGAILGMTKDEIKRKFDEIVAFAEVEKFIDTPVKRYSSGMYVRLAFAVAAHLEPEIIIVDEVLAVGDAAFQKKCLEKMGVVAKEGRTVLFVSHNMKSISILTQKCINLSQGQCVYKGDTETAIHEYLKKSTNDNLIYASEASATNPCVTRVELHTSKPNNIQINGEPMEVSIDISTPRNIREAFLSFQMFNDMGQPFVHLQTNKLQLLIFQGIGIFRLICKIPKLHLYKGNYTLTIHLAEPEGGERFQRIEDICPFEVIMFGKRREYGWQPGVCTYIEQSEWHVKKLDTSNSGKL